MLEPLLMGTRLARVEDDYDLPFPPGTPFRGVVHSRDFISGSQLSRALNFGAGTLINDQAGWLHFIEDNGYEIYIAKKPIRCAITWAEINSAQSGKVVTVQGREFTVEFLTGARTDPSPIDNAKTGGQWNRYIYNVYGGPSKGELSGREDWGNYTAPMLGMVERGGEVNLPGSGTYTKEAADGVEYGYVNRGRNPQGGVSPIAAIWYARPVDVSGAAGVAMGWRPMLVLKGTSPPEPVTPFKGEIAQTSLITASALAAAVGLNVGTEINANTPWLKIVEGGVTYYLAKTSMRNNLTKEQLTALGLVTGSKTTVIGGKTYKVRLMTGRLPENTSMVGGEWKRWYTALTDGTWATYSPSQLITGTGTNNNGQLPLVQENESRGAAANGYPGLMGTWYQPANTPNAGYGWRPVLELVG